MGVQINGDTGNISATKADYSGNVTIGGTLTYEDVTNIDSVGLITAREGIEVGARPGVAASISVDGNAIFSGITTVGSKIDVTNDTHGNLNAVLARGADPTFQLQSRNNQHSNSPQSGIATFGAFYSDNEIVALNFMRGTGSSGAGSLGIIQAGEEKIRINSDGYLGIGTASVNTPLHVHNSTVNGVALFESGDVYCSLVFQDSNSNDSGKPQFGVQGDDFRWVTHDGSSSAERIRLKNSGELLINQSSVNTYVDGAGYSQTPLLQVVSNDNISTMMSLRYNSGAGAAGRRASFIFARTADGTAVSNNSVLGEVLFMGEGNSTLEKAASISAAVDGTPGSNDMPGRLMFSTSADGSDSPTERLRITQNGQILIGHDTASTNFHDPQTTTDRAPQIQLHGSNSVQSSAALVSWNSNAGSYYSNALFLAHSGSSTVGTNGIVSSSNTLGSIVFSGDDGDEFIKGAMISSRVDGTPGADDMPARLMFYTNDGSDAPAERLRIDKNGNIISNGGNTARIAWGTVGGVLYSGFSRYDGAAQDVGISHYATTNAGTSFVEHFRMEHNGTLKGTDTSIGSLSDIRLKKDIKDYSYDISKFKQFKPKSFNWINPEVHGDKSNVKGFIAQDIELVDKDWVEDSWIRNDDPDYDLVKETSTKNGLGDDVGISKISKFGYKDAMYISVIQQLISRIETLESS